MKKMTNLCLCLSLCTLLGACVGPGTGPHGTYTPADRQRDNTNTALAVGATAVGAAVVLGNSLREPRYVQPRRAYRHTPRVRYVQPRRAYRSPRVRYVQPRRAYRHTPSVRYVQPRNVHPVYPASYRRPYYR